MDTPQPLSFSDFLEKMKDPAAADLVRNIKIFIKQFEDRPPNQLVDPEIDKTRVQEFMAKSEEMFGGHAVWRGSLPAVLDQAVEGLEKYIMSKVWRQTFGVSQEDKDRDERYSRLMRALGFVDLSTLLGVEGVDPDPSLLAMAQGELLKMDKYKAPRDKLLCLVNVKTMVENIVQEAVKRGAKIGGADAFFPVLLFIVIRSCLPRLASNVEFIKRFRMASRLTGQFDYMLCNLESSAMYLDTVDYQHLRISQEDFLMRLAAAGIPEAHLELQRLQQQQQQQHGWRDGGELCGLDQSGGALVGGDGGGQGRGGEQLAEGRLGGGAELLAEQVACEKEAQQADHEASQPGIAANTPGSSTTPGQGGVGSEERGLSPLPQGTPVGLSMVGPGMGPADDVPAPDASRRKLFQEGAAAAATTQTCTALVEPSFVEDMVGEGTRHVLGAEARGELQLKYPYMYASPADLSVSDVAHVLAGYKALAFRYEALALSLRSQLGGAAPPQQAARQLSAATPQLSTSSLEWPMAGERAQQPARGFASAADHHQQQQDVVPGGSSLEQAGGGESGMGSPSRRSLLHRNTSLSGRSSSSSSNKGEVGAGGATPPASSQLPALSTKAKEALQGPGSSLLNRLFDTPQRQAQRRLRDAAGTGTAGAEAVQVVEEGAVGSSSCFQGADAAASSPAARTGPSGAGATLEAAGAAQAEAGALLSECDGQGARPAEELEAAVYDADPTAAQPGPTREEEGREVERSFAEAAVGQPAYQGHEFEGQGSQEKQALPGEGAKVTVLPEEQDEVMRGRSPARGPSDRDPEGLDTADMNAVCSTVENAGCNHESASAFAATSSCAPQQESEEAADEQAAQVGSGDKSQILLDGGLEKHTIPVLLPKEHETTLLGGRESANPLVPSAMQQLESPIGAFLESEHDGWAQEASRHEDSAMWNATESQALQTNQFGLLRDSLS